MILGGNNKQMIVIAHTKMKSLGLVAMLALTTAGLTATSQAAPVTLNASKDTYVRSGGNAALNYGSASMIQVKNAFGNTNSGDAHRKSYIGFGLGAVVPATVTSATLSLTVASNTSNLVGNNINNEPYTFHVYGLLEAQDNWDESTLTWNTAASYGNDTTSPNNIVGEVDLGTFTINGFGGAPGSTVSFTSAALTSFVQSDTNGTISIVLARDTQEFNPPTPGVNKNENTLAQNFLTKEGSTTNMEKLIVNAVTAVPEAGALTLIVPALGLLGLVTLRKSRKA